MPVSNPIVAVKAVTESSSEVISWRGWNDPDQQCCRTPCTTLVMLPASPVASSHQQNFTLLQVDKSVPQRRRDNLSEQRRYRRGLQPPADLLPRAFCEPSLFTGQPRVSFWLLQPLGVVVGGCLCLPLGLLSAWFELLKLKLSDLQ